MTRVKRVLEAIEIRLMIARQFKGMIPFAVMALGVLTTGSVLFAQPPDPGGMEFRCIMCLCTAMYTHDNMYPQGCSSFGLLWPETSCGNHMGLNCEFGEIIICC